MPFFWPEAGSRPPSSSRIADAAKSCSTRPWAAADVSAEDALAAAAAPETTFPSLMTAASSVVVLLPLPLPSAF